MRIAIAIIVLALSGCAAPMRPPPPGAPGGPTPVTGSVIYRCAGGAQLAVDFEANSARVAIVGGPSMVLPNAGSAAAPNYTNGRYALRGGGVSATWQTPGAAPVPCQGS